MTLALEDDLLYCIVFGPGFGESILLRTPGQEWVVVDGCRYPRKGNGISPAASMLREREVSWSAVVFTHPHEDHAAGLDEVLAWDGFGPVGCCPVAMDPLGQGTDSLDPERHYRRGSVEQVLSTIQDLWEREPDSRWELFRGSRRVIGDMALTVLHPDKGRCQEVQKPNQLASALLLEWGQCRILLGADVEHEDWEEIQTVYPDLAHHAGMKYPHHGSLGAYHPVFAEGGEEERFWVMTPWNRGRKLPRYEDGEGLDKALKACPRIHLTGLPLRHDLQAKPPYHTTREALRDGKEPLLQDQTLPVGLSFTLLPEAEPLSHYVVAGFDKDGNLKDLQHGAGTVVVRAQDGEK